MTKGQKISLGVLQLFIGLGAVGGGLAFVLKPDGSMLGFPLDILNRTPFTDFFVPGLLLMLVHGFGNLMGAAMSFKGKKCAGVLAILLGLFLTVWILAQIYWFSTCHWVHVVYLILGVGEFILGWRMGQLSPLKTDEPVQ